MFKLAATTPLLKRAIPWSLLVLVIALVDQSIKAWIKSYFALGQGTYITSFFNLWHVRNYGAAFSFLSDAGGWQRWFFMAVAIGAFFFLGWMLLENLRKHQPEAKLSWALTLILGGAVGNLIDRIGRGFVVDYLDFHAPWLAWLFHAGHFPSFNLADCAISVGAALLLWTESTRPTTTNT